mgnify:CR=1 FL=1
MTYSETELQQIEKYASIYLKISDIAVILDIPADVLRSDIADRGTDVSKAYRRGKAASKVKLHSQEMMLAGRIAARHRERPPQSARHGGR